MNIRVIVTAVAPTHLYETSISLPPSIESVKMVTDHNIRHLVKYMQCKKQKSKYSKWHICFIHAIGLVSVKVGECLH